MKHVKALIRQLLDKNNPSNRLGGSYANLKAHPFFDGFDWDSLYNRTMQPAFLINSQEMLCEEKIRKLQQVPISYSLLEDKKEKPVRRERREGREMVGGWD